MSKKSLPLIANFSPLALSRVLLALDEAGHLMPVNVKADAERQISLNAELLEDIETQFISRQLKNRPRNCPELHALLGRLTNPSCAGSPD